MTKPTFDVHLSVRRIETLLRVLKKVPHSDPDAEEVLGKLVPTLESILKCHALGRVVTVSIA